MRESDHFLVWQDEETNEEARDIEKTINKGYVFYNAQWKILRGKREVRDWPHHGCTEQFVLG